MANLDQYRAVLEDLTKQRSELSFKIGKIDDAVALLRRLMPIEDTPPLSESQQALPIITDGKYFGMSTRWAVLSLLTEDATGPLTTGQIAEALQQGGMHSEAKSFAGNVSAVLSGMRHEKGEVIASENGWTISDKGKQDWIDIKAHRDRKAQLPREFVRESPLAPSSVAATLLYPETANA